MSCRLHRLLFLNRAAPDSYPRGPRVVPSRVLVTLTLNYRGALMILKIVFSRPLLQQHKLLSQNLHVLCEQGDLLLQARILLLQSPDLVLLALELLLLHVEVNAQL